MKYLWISGFFLVVFFCSGRAQACTRDELEMVQIISLHGSMSPKHVYPEDPNPASAWAEGLDDITMLGKFQAYAMGVFLSNFYRDFITTDPRELEVISSADKGAVKSAQSLVTAMYSPNPYWEVVANFSWQPIYINYDTDENKYLSNRICPAAEAEHKRLLFSEATSAVLQTYQDFIYYWGVHSGMELKSLVEIEELFQILQTESSYNLTIPEWSINYWNEMKYLHDISIALRTKSKKLQRLRGGSLMGHTIKKMKEKSENDMDPRKVIFYSTHTIPMRGFLASLDLGFVARPPPVATILVELYLQKGEHFVRYVYLNSTMPQRDPQVLYSISVPGCTEFCPLNYVIEYTKDAIPRNLEQECFMV